MKIISMLLILITMVFGCKKKVSPDCLRARIVRTTCASIVMQALNNNSIGEDNWKDVFDNNTHYDNAFAISNPCGLPSGYKVGDVVYITIAKATTSDCIRCALYDAPPLISYDIKAIGKFPCDEESK
ncbi:MAG: hypothetical protein ABIN89_13360 [Chitinophagaceae bacterium]